MNRTFAAGIGLTAVGLVGYVIGIAVAYPGRELSIIGVMVGLTTLAVGLSGEES